MSQPGPPRSQPTRAWPTQHRPLWRTRPFKEPTVLEEASLTAAHLGPGWGGPGRGGFSLIVFRHQLWRLESQTAERGPEAPWSRARPQAVSHEGPSWDPPPWPLPVPAITVHQAPGLPPASGVWVLSKLHRGKQGGSSTPLHSPRLAPGHCQAQSSTRGLTHMEIPPTLLPLYREKSKNNLACAREQQARRRALAPSWDVLESRLRTASASWLTLGNHCPNLGLPSSSK